MLIDVAIIAAWLIPIMVLHVASVAANRSLLAYKGYVERQLSAKRERETFDEMVWRSTYELARTTARHIVEDDIKLLVSARLDSQKRSQSGQSRYDRPDEVMIVETVLLPERRLHCGALVSRRLIPRDYPLRL